MLPIMLIIIIEVIGRWLFNDNYNTVNLVVYYITQAHPSLNGIDRKDKYLFDYYIFLLVSYKTKMTAEEHEVKINENSTSV